MNDQPLQMYQALRTYRIDGNRFSTLEGFYDEVSSVLIPEMFWGRNLDAFNDVLRGGFGTPDEGFILIWKNSEASAFRLGYPGTVRQLELRLQTCHATARRSVKAELRNAHKSNGPTAFDWIIEIIRVHGPGGEEAEDNVRLKLQ